MSKNLLKAVQYLSEEDREALDEAMEAKYQEGFASALEGTNRAAHVLRFTSFLAVGFLCFVSASYTLTAITSQPTITVAAPPPPEVTNYWTLWYDDPQNIEDIQRRAFTYEGGTVTCFKFDLSGGDFDTTGCYYTPTEKETP